MGISVMNNGEAGACATYQSGKTWNQKGSWGPKEQAFMMSWQPLKGYREKVMVS